MTANTFSCFFLASIALLSISAQLGEVHANGLTSTYQTTDNREETPDVSDEDWLSQPPPETGTTEEPRGLLVPTEKSIEKFCKRVEGNSRDEGSAIVLGRLYLRQAKENDDFHSYVQAEQVFRNVLTTNPESLAAKAYLAEALMAQHRFAEAEKLASQVVAQDPQATLSMATLGDAHLQLGHYDEAQAVLEKLLKLTESPPVLARVAQIRELKGDVEGAIELLTKALQLQTHSSGLADTEAWYTWRLAKACLAAGQSKKAQQLFQQAIDLNSEDAASLAALGMMAAGGGELELAVEWYLKAVAAQEAPPILGQLGDVYALAGQSEKATAAYKRAEQLMDEEANDQLAGPAHARERAIFFADHDLRLAEALTLAQQDLDIRQDIYAYDTLAWALYKNNRLDAAAEAMQHAMSLGTRDPKLFFHQAMIELARGNSESGRGLLKRALATNAAFSVLEPAIARKLLTQ